MTTIHIEYAVPATKMEAINQHLEDVTMRDPNWNGVEFKIERDDFTCIPHDESPEAVVLLRQIEQIIDGRSED